MGRGLNLGLGSWPARGVWPPLGCSLALGQGGLLPGQVAGSSQLLQGGQAGRERGGKRVR